MTPGTAPPTAGYWYGETTEADGDPRRALEALRSYRAAELAMRKRTRDEMAMNDFMKVSRNAARSGPGCTLSPFDAVAHAWSQMTEQERQAYWRRTSGRADSISTSKQKKATRDHKSRK